MDKKKLSIIIPCYNVGKYIERCFKSIEKQTIGFDNIEVIFVNDVSTDDTLNKLTAIEGSHPENVMVINLEQNSGPGAARNIALEYATADFIGYVDSDDWIEPDMYEKMFSAMDKYDCDFVECYWDTASDERHRKSVRVLGREGFYDLADDKTRERFYGNQIAMTSVWNKLFKKSFIVDNDIFFPEQLHYEDVFFCYLAFLYAKSCYRINKPLYHYFVNDTGIVHQRGKDYQLEKMDIAVGFINTCRERGLYDANPVDRYGIDWMFLEKYYIYMLWEIFNQFPELSYTAYSSMREVVLETVPDYKENPYRNWESNKFDNLMLKLLDKPLSEEALGTLRLQMLKKFN
jgi:glycosyltransferase involved in cell wall biosynthesis